MSETLTLLLLSALAFGGFWLAGGYPVRMLVIAREGSSEFGRGTPSRLRRLKGYGVFATWLILAATTASYFADWAVHGDPGAAADRLADRLEIAVHLLEAMGED
jgi:hypothetical protein